MCAVGRQKEGGDVTPQEVMDGDVPSTQVFVDARVLPPVTSEPERSTEGPETPATPVAMFSDLTVS